MDEHRWERVRALFDEAEGLPADERDTFLRDACGDDDELLAELTDLFAADAAVETHDDVAGIVLRAALDMDGAAGDRIGPYRVVREMGSGGMGRVFLAERADGQFEQTVALKLLRIGLSTPELLERFRLERQILARLQHPNIARLLDGGVTDEGQPYFALDYVEGEPIDRYCDRVRLSIEERLALFQDVCRALVYAHANLVVHRDLKPDNILTTEDGQVRLLDFGIAKVMAEDDQVPNATRTAMVAMTPAYASPEQVRGEPVGTATDVYSLGIILYELLTGTRPYDVQGRRPTEVERLVAEVEPERPSARVAHHATRGDVDAEAIVGARGADPDRLVRRLSGDLDVICMKALRKEPEKRYGSVEALLDDIQRHLDGRPVVARPATLRYRLGKGIRRNRWAVGAAATVLVTSSSLVAFYTARLADERDRAQLEAAKAVEVASFLQGLFEVSDPDEAQGATITARELLDAGAARVEQELAGQPEVQANMLLVIGQVYSQLGLFGEARPLLERAVELHDRNGAAAGPDLALSRLALAQVLQAAGDFDGARPVFERAMETFHRAYSEDDPELWEATRHYAYWHETDGNYEEAEAHYRVALEGLRATAGEGDERVVSAVAGFGNFLRQMDEVDEAEALLREALASQRTLYGNMHPDVASTARVLAALLRDHGDLDESEALYREALAIRREVLGPNHPEVASTLNSYAILAERRGEPERAIQIFREFIAILDVIHDEPHPDEAAAFHNLALSLRDQGQLEESAELFGRSISVQDAVLRPEHPSRAFPRIGLASVLRERGEPEQAEVILREALAIRRQALPEGHRHIAEALSDLGAALMDQGRYDEAEPLLLEAYATATAAEGPDASRATLARSRLGALYDALGRPDEAAKYRDGARP